MSEITVANLNGLGEAQPVEIRAERCWDAVFFGQIPLAEFSFKCRTRGETSDPLPAILLTRCQRISNDFPFSLVHEALRLWRTSRSRA